MFDRIMQQSLPLWLLSTLAFGILVATLLIRAALRIRHLRSLLNEATREAMAAAASDGRRPAHPWQAAESKDWIAQP
jgi:ABC-type sulfate transport system permease component